MTYLMILIIGIALGAWGLPGLAKYFNQHQPKLRPPKEINTADYLIVANGPFLSEDLICEAAQGRKIIALDGAADKLLLLNIIPHIILGDFDSITQSKLWGITQTFSGITESSQAYLNPQGIEIIPAKNQMLTDLDKAIDYCDNHAAQSITIVCATGGRVDHTLGNIRRLRRSYKPNRPLHIHTSVQSLLYVKDTEVTMTGKIGDYCGIMAFPTGSFSSQGLAYDFDNYQLEFGITESTCNEMKSNTAMIHITGEALIIHPPMLVSQRS